MLMHMDGYMHQGSKLFLQGLSEMQLALWVRTGKPECISVDINTLVNLSFIIFFPIDCNFTMCVTSVIQWNVDIPNLYRIKTLV